MGGRLVPLLGLPRVVAERTLQHETTRFVIPDGGHEVVTEELNTLVGDRRRKPWRSHRRHRSAPARYGPPSGACYADREMLGKSLTLAWLAALAACACSGSGGTTGTGGTGGAASSGGTGAVSGGGGNSGNGASAGTGGGSGGSVSCAALGGQCQCAGGCSTGFHSAGAADCPQPCAGCGACSQECCVPDAADSGTDAGSLFEQCGSGVCPPDPPGSGAACNSPGLCCGYTPPGSVYTGCTCGATGWTCVLAGACFCG